MRTDIPVSPGSRLTLSPSQRSPHLKKLDIAIKFRRPVDIGRTTATDDARDARDSPRFGPKMALPPQPDQLLTLPDSGSVRSRSSVSERSDRSDDSSDRFEREHSQLRGKKPTRKRASKPKVRTGEF